MSKSWSWKETGQVKIKNLLAQTILDKIFRTNWSNPVKLDRKKRFTYVSACFLAAICKV